MSGIIPRAKFKCNKPKHFLNYNGFFPDEDDDEAMDEDEQEVLEQMIKVIVYFIYIAPTLGPFRQYVGLKQCSVFLVRILTNI